MKQTILHIIPRYYPGGAERLVLEYATSLDPARYDVHVASCVDDGALRASFEAIGAQIWIGTGKRRAIFRALKKHVHTLQPDIIHTHLLSSDVTGALLKRAFPHIIWISTLHNTEDDRPWLYRKIWKWALRRVDHVIAVASQVAMYAEKTFAVPKEKIITIPNGIDLPQWIAVDTDHLFDQRPYQLATMGRLETQKGHRYLLEALSHLKKYDWEYHLYGDGSLKAELEALVKERGIASRVIFHGNVSNLPERLAEIDLIIQPSLWEGMSLTILEAMAAGRPLIATFAAGDTIVKHEKTGYLVPEKDAFALQKTIAQVLSHGDQAKRVARAARAHAIEHFSIQHNVYSVEALYTNVTKSNTQ